MTRTWDDRSDDDEDESERDKQLSRTYDWIDTLIEKEGLGSERKGVAHALARDRIGEDGSDMLPKKIARWAVEDSEEHV